jgi:hypothetical protein
MDNGAENVNRAELRFATALDKALEAVSQWLDKSTEYPEVELHSNQIGAVS